MLGFILCHGFGFAGEFWQELGMVLQDYPVIVWDLGYFGARNVEIPHDTGIEWIGIGHSLGFIKLLQSGIKFKKLIGLQAFVNFLGFDPKLRRVRARFLQKMQDDLEREPRATLRAFWRLCGLKQDFRDVTDLNVALLQADLARLSGDFSQLLAQNGVYGGGESAEMLILGTKTDPIVPKCLIEDNFTGICPYQISTQESGHLLGDRGVIEFIDILDFD